MKKNMSKNKEIENENKEMNKETVSKNKGKNCMKVWGTIIVIIFLVIIALDEGFMAYYMFNNKSNLDPDTIKSTVESSLLSTGLEIIGLAVAVWTGLNIMNAVSRHEVNEIKDELGEIMKSKEELTEIINNMDNKSKSEFLLELLKTNKDEMSRYYYEKFQGENISFSKLVEVENVFNKIYEMHANGNVSSEQIIIENEELKSKIAETKEYINDISKKNESKILESYFKLREADGLFYMGYELDNKDKKYDTYNEAVTIYLDVIKDLGIGFPEYNSKVIFKDHNNFWKITVNQYYKNAELFAYFANSIGEAYGNMALANPKSRKAYIEDIAKKAIFYERLAVDCAEKHNMNKEVYYKNLGCNYERLERIETSNTSFESTEALDNYKKAFELTINKTQLSSKQTWRFYFTYLTYLNKYIKYNLKLDLTAKNDNLEVTSNISDKQLKKIIEKIYDMSKVAMISVIDDIRRSSNIAMYGFANGYISLLKRNKIADEIFIENEDYYLEKMKWAIDTLNIMNINDDFYNQLNLFYKKLKP